MPEVSIFFIGVGDREHRLNSIHSCTMQHQSPLSIMCVIEPKVINHLHPYFPGISMSQFGSSSETQIRGVSAIPVRRDGSWPHPGDGVVVEKAAPR